MHISINCSFDFYPFYGWTNLTDPLIKGEPLGVVNFFAWKRIHFQRWNNNENSTRSTEVRINIWDALVDITGSLIRRRSRNTEVVLTDAAIAVSHTSTPGNYQRNASQTWHPRDHSSRTAVDVASVQSSSHNIVQCTLLPNVGIQARFCESTTCLIDP